MANEASVRVSLRVRKTSSGDVLMDESLDLNYREDVDGTRGPTPGSIAVPEVGVSVDLSELSVPGLCGMRNQGAYPVNWGVMDPESGRFFAVGTMDPGKGAYLGKMYQFFGEFEIEGTGTGSFSSPYYLHLKAVGGASRVFVGAFEA